MTKLLFCIKFWNELIFCGGTRARARREVRSYIKANIELRSMQPNIFFNFVDVFFKHRGPIWFIFLYCVAILFILILGQLTSSQRCTVLFKNERDTLGQINLAFLTVQLVMIALVLPVTISLVSMLLQIHEKTPANLKINIYYLEARVFETVSTSFVLLIALLLDQVISLYSFFDLFISIQNKNSIQCLLTLIHFLWLIFNIIAVWNVVMFSLQFVHRPNRRYFIRRFTARDSIPSDLEDQITRSYCRKYEYFGFSVPDEDKPHVRLGHVIQDTSAIEVKTSFRKTRTLYDVKPHLLNRAVSRWLDRALRHWNMSTQNYSSDVPILIFPLTIGSRTSGTVEICYRTGSCALTKWEKFLICRSFVFREDRK